MSHRDEDYSLEEDDFLSKHKGKLYALAFALITYFIWTSDRKYDPDWWSKWTQQEQVAPDSVGLYSRSIPDEKAPDTVEVSKEFSHPKGEESARKIIKVSAETSAALHVTLYREDGTERDSISENTYNQLIWLVYELTTDEESASVESLFQEIIEEDKKGVSIKKWYSLKPGKTWLGPEDPIDRD